MLTKISRTLIFTVLISLMVFSPGLAQAEIPEGQPKRGQRFLGQVTAVDTSQFVILTRDGESLEISVDDNTKYRNAKDAGDFSDIEKGCWVAGFAADGDDQGLTARLVVILPQDFDPEKLPDGRMLGSVTKINLDDQTVTLKSLNGEDEKTFIVNASTKFVGGKNSLADLTVGMNAAVGFREDEDGSLLAISVGARFPQEKYAGTIVSVDSEKNSFSMKTRNDINITIMVNDETKFRSKDDDILGLADLLPEMVVVVVAIDSGEDYPVALTVGAGTKEQLPEIDLRVTGKVTGIESDRFSVEARNGESYTILISTETKFRSPRGGVESLEKMKEGMVVIVAADENAEGEYTAIIVSVKSVRNLIKQWFSPKP